MQLIDDTLAEWADTLRTLGNIGAHYTAAVVTRQDAEDALAFAEALALALWRSCSAQKFAQITDPHPVSDDQPRMFQGPQHHFIRTV